MTTREFLATLVGEQVKVIPEVGRKHIGRLTALEGTDDDPVLVVHVAGIRHPDKRTPWSQTCRVLVGSVIPIVHSNRGAR